MFKNLIKYSPITCIWIFTLIKTAIISPKFLTYAANVTGFKVFFGPRILPWQKRSMEILDRYIIRASFSQSAKAATPAD